MNTWENGNIRYNIAKHEIFSSYTIPLEYSVFFTSLFSFQFLVILHNLTLSIDRDIILNSSFK